jgi:hypothetical protein
MELLFDVFDFVFVFVLPETLYAEMSDTSPVTASVATILHGSFGLSNTRCRNLVTCMSHVCSPPPLYLPFIRPA